MRCCLLLKFILSVKQTLIFPQEWIFGKVCQTSLGSSTWADHLKIIMEKKWLFRVIKQLKTWGYRMQCCSETYIHNGEKLELIWEIVGPSWIISLQADLHLANLTKESLLLRAHIRLTLTGVTPATHTHTPPLTPLLRSLLFAHISEKWLLDEVIIAFLNDFMLRHTVTPTYSKRVCSLGVHDTKTIRPASVSIGVHISTFPLLCSYKNTHTQTRVFVPLRPLWFAGQMWPSQVKHKSLSVRECLQQTQSPLLSQLTVSEKQPEHQWTSSSLELIPGLFVCVCGGGGGGWGQHEDYCFYGSWWNSNHQRLYNVSWQTLRVS